MFTTLAQNSAGGAAAGAAGAVFGIAVLLIIFAIVIIIIAGFWKMFVKAGHPGWAAIVPVYNSYIMCKIAGRPGWWVILLFLPWVGLIFSIILLLDLAKSFGKGVGFAVGMILLGFIFIPILGFGSAEYEGPAAA